MLIAARGDFEGGMGLCGLPDVARKGDAGWIWGGDAQAADGEWGAPVLKGLGSPGSRWAVTWHATIPASLSLADKLVVAPTSLNEGRGEGDGAAYPRCPRRCSQC